MVCSELSEFGQAIGVQKIKIKILNVLRSLLVLEYPSRADHKRTCIFGVLPRKKLNLKFALPIGCGATPLQLKAKFIICLPRPTHAPLASFFKISTLVVRRVVVNEQVYASCAKDSNQPSDTHFVAS